MLVFISSMKRSSLQYFNQYAMQIYFSMNKPINVDGLRYSCTWPPWSQWRCRRGRRGRGRSQPLCSSTLQRMWSLKWITFRSDLNNFKYHLFTYWENAAESQVAYRFKWPLPLQSWAYERIRQWPVTDIRGWPLVNESSHIWLTSRERIGVKYNQADIV